MGRDQGPKYLNTSDGELYHKREVLYGIALARPAAAKAGRMVLAEGYTDVLALHQAGVRNAVGIMGTSLTKEQVAELVRTVRVLELCLDADRAGQDAMVRAADLCADSNLELRVVPLPPGADPGELIRTEGTAALRDRVATSVPYVVFDVERILERSDLDSAEGKDRAIAELREPFSRLGQSVLRDDLLRRGAGAMALSEGRLAALLVDGRSSTGVDGRVRPGVAGPRPDGCGRRAVCRVGDPARDGFRPRHPARAVVPGDVRGGASPGRVGARGDRRRCAPDRRCPAPRRAPPVRAAVGADDRACPRRR